MARTSPSNSKRRQSESTSSVREKEEQPPQVEATGDIEDGPKTHTQKSPNAAERFSAEHHGTYEARGKQSRDDQVKRVHQHNNACPKMYDELAEREALSKPKAVQVSITKRKDTHHKQRRYTRVNPRSRITKRNQRFKKNNSTPEKKVRCNCLNCRRFNRRSHVSMSSFHSVSTFDYEPMVD